MSKGLVSVLTPCFNSGAFVHRLMDSLLAQTYPNLEMFVIDDGSSDNTAEVLKSYIPKFASRGYQLTYVYQENAGQSVAIEKGLKLFSGDYLVWPDSDDFYATNDAIERMVSVLEKSDEAVSMVRTHSSLLDEDSLCDVGSYSVTTEARGKTDLFEDCMLGENGYWYVPGNYMAKAEVVLQCLPDRSIYTSRYAGQNWQLMLPLLYQRQCLTIEEYLYSILVRKSSHSRSGDSYESISRQNEIYKETILQTLKRIKEMPLGEQDALSARVKVKYLSLGIRFSATFCRRNELQRMYLELKRISPPAFMLRILYIVSRIPCGLWFARLVAKIKGMAILLWNPKRKGRK